MSALEQAAVCARRRARVLELLGPDAALVLPAGPELVHGRDGEVRYLPDADLFYLTGYEEPEAVLVLCPAWEEAPYTLFVRPRDPERERWTGVRGGAEAALERFGADAAYPLEELGERLASIVAGTERLYAPLRSGRTAVDDAVRAVLEAGERSHARRGRGPRALVSPRVLLDELRLVKEPGEIAAIRAAAALTVAAFREAAAAVGPGVGEWVVEAALESGFRSRGARGPAFPSIVAAGGNATVLHYVANDHVMRAGELVLVDAGARLGMYCADVSRTWAVGRVDGARAELHAVVRAAHNAAVDAVRPGATVQELHALAALTLAEGLVQLGVLAEVPEEAAEADALRRFYPHRTSHWLGLDVHDVGDYVRGDEPRPLAAGMVLTIEPGLYIPADDEAAPAGLRGVGVRIEDDVLVTPNGRELLTGELPTGLAL
ncbi:MAG: aminopeptidase P N-terminal domain-containing protein [Gemmatimonadota bacterium]